MDVPRRNPTSVSPSSAARSTASDEGAETAASNGIPAIAAFCTSSNDARPLTISAVPDSGTSPPRVAQPTTLSTALWRPTSSRRQRSFPSASNKPAACRPPVRSKTRCAARSSSGRPASVAGSAVNGSAAMGQVTVVRTASKLALPHSPHDEVV